MSDIKNISEVIDSASMIVCGYAFIQMNDGNIRIVGLEEPNHAAVIRRNGEMLETDMDEIEFSIIQNYWQRNKECMEEVDYA